MGRKLRGGGETHTQKTSGTKILSFVANCNDYNKEATLIYIQNIFYFQIHSICIFLEKKYIVCGFYGCYQAQHLSNN